MPAKYELLGKQARKNKRTKYKYKNPHLPHGSSHCPGCFLCKQWLRRDRWRIGVCERCERSARDPMFVKYARDYFNDPDYYRRLLLTIEVLDSVYSMIKQTEEFRLMLFNSDRRMHAQGGEVNVSTDTSKG
jgi:hypothetical protein